MPLMLGAGSANSAGHQRSFWETILTTTPVVLTVLATVLAGLSQSELTQAQFYRSAAAQEQSKAGDQWAFFQAKRIRGTVLEQALPLLPPITGKIDPQRLETAAQQISQQFQSGRKEVSAARQAVSGTTGQPGADQPAAREAADQLAQLLETHGAEAVRAYEAVKHELTRREVRAAFAYLGTNQLPPVATTVAWDDPAIGQYFQGVRDRLPEDQLDSLVMAIDTDQLKRALVTADANRSAFEDVAKGVDQVLKDLDESVKKAARLGQAFSHAARDLSQALGDMADQAKSPRSALEQSDRLVQRAVRTCQTYQAARADYAARRNEREARDNQQVAGLQEIRVRQDTVASERHRKRSKNIFYGMLGAQGGVATASLALAARRKSTLWTLAGLTGLAAAAFSAYVYLYL
jgi:hypothetical protein